MEMIPCFVCGSLLKSSLNEITNGRAFIEQTIKVKAALECCLFSELLDLESVLGNKRTKWYHWWLEYPEITLNRGITPQPSPPEKKCSWATSEHVTNVLITFKTFSAFSNWTEHRHKGTEHKTDTEQRWTMVSTIRLSSQLIHCKHTCRKKNWYAGKFSTYKIVTRYVKFTFPSPITLSPFHFKHYLLRALCFFQDCCFNLHKVSSMEENVRATVTRLGEKSHLLASQLDKY